LFPHRHAVELSEESEVVEARDAAVEASVTTEDESDFSAYFQGVRDHVQAKNSSCAARWQEKRREDLDRRRLPGAVWAEEAEQLSSPDRERDPSDGLDLSRSTA
jgi:hypothetical protein